MLDTLDIATGFEGPLPVACLDFQGRRAGVAKIATWIAGICHVDCHVSCRELCTLATEGAQQCTRGYDIVQCTVYKEFKLDVGAAREEEQWQGYK